MITEWEIYLKITFCIIGLMLFIIGICLPKCKRNYIIGIKIKWTLENEENWNATHRMSGKLWALGGLLFVACSFLPELVLPWVLTSLIILLVGIPIIYSYNYHKKQLKEGTAIVTPLPENRYEKFIIVGTTIFLVITFIFVGVICFTGDIFITYKDNSFEINASYWSDIDIQYEEIDSIEYRDNFNKGYRINGFGTTRLSMGKFKNDEFGVYTLYSYTDCKSAVVINAKGKILVIGGTDSNSTKGIYEEIINRK